MSGVFYQESGEYDARATRWFDGLVNKDIQITNEVYSVREVEFDRQVIFIIFFSVLLQIDTRLHGFT